MNKLDLITTGRFWLEIEFNGTCYQDKIDSIFSEIVHNAWKIPDDIMDNFGEKLEYIIDHYTSYNYSLIQKEIREEEQLKDIAKDF